MDWEGQVVMSRTGIQSLLTRAAAAAVTASAIFMSAASFADPLGYAGSFDSSRRAVEQILPASEARVDLRDANELPSHLRRRTVDYPTREAPGTIVIDTPNKYLYYVLGQGRAIRYGIGVGREGFTWAGTQSIARKQEWPDWHPPTEMIERQPYLPRFMAGGPGNPLGARALYLGTTVYRIHGTNQPQTIGTAVSSGCFRLTNPDVTDLYDRIPVGTKVIIRQQPEI
jgi:lipoprotein-anchoring transpeptidase ErfK/SrfK